MIRILGAGDMSDKDSNDDEDRRRDRDERAKRQEV